MKFILFIISFLLTSLFFYSEIRAQNVLDFCQGMPSSMDVSAIVETSDNNYIVAGTQNSGPLALDCFVRKVSADGTVLWSNQIDATSNTGNDYCYDMCETSSGNFLLCGTSPSTMGYSVFLAEVDSSGTMIKNRKYEFSDQVEAHSIIKTHTNGFAVTGLTGSDFLYFGLFDSSLNILNSQISFIGSFGESIIETRDSGFAIAGYENPNNPRAYFMKLDAYGNIQWTRIMTGSAASYANAVTQTDNGDYILCGTKYSTVTSFDIYLVKFSNSGNLLWAKTFASTTLSAQDEALSIISTHDSGYAVTGYTYSSRFIMKFNQNDSLLWSYDYWFPGYLSKSIKETNDHGLVIAGQSFLMKTDSMRNNCAMNPVTFLTDTGGTFNSGGTFTSFFPTQIDTMATIFPGDPSSFLYCITLTAPQIEQVSDQPLIFPNPSNGIFNIKVPPAWNSKECHVEIYDLFGDKIFNQTIEESSHIINLSNASPGIYFLRIQNGSFILTKNLIKN